jgi:hypothetical protein
LWSLLRVTLGRSITNHFAALENLKVDGMEIRRAWKILETAKDGKSLGKGNLNPQLHKYAGGHYMEDYCFFVTPFT